MRIRQQPHAGIHLRHTPADDGGGPPAPPPADPPDPQILVHNLPNPDVSRLVTATADDLDLIENEYGGTEAAVAHAALCVRPQLM